MATQKKAVFVDGNALFYRAFFALPASLSASDGTPTNAAFGFATALRKLLSGRRPEVGVVVFDPPGRTVRDEKYEAYKADRPSMPSDLQRQLPFIDDIVKVNGLKSLRVPGYEADDVIATLAEQAKHAGYDVVVLSPDKDFLQLVDDAIRVHEPIRDVSYDAVLVKKKWGVLPGQFVDLLALMGDAIDNIPGVAGVGQKGAATLLEKYQSLDGVYAALADLSARQRTALEKGKGDAFLSRDLVLLDRAVPLPLAFDALGLDPVDEEGRAALYRRLDFNSLLDAKSKATRDAAPLAPAEIVDDSALLSALIGTLVATTPAIVPIHDGPSAARGTLVGFAFATDAAATYVPATEATLRALRGYFEDDAAKKIFHDAKQTYVLLANVGISLRGVHFDTLLGSYLVDPTKLVPHRLDQVAREYLQRTLPAAKEVTGSGQAESPFASIDRGVVAAYACALATACLAAAPKVRARLDALPFSAEFERLELPLAFVLGDMERAGIRVDAADVERIGAFLEERLAGIEAEIHRLAGHPFNIGSTKQLADVLFEELKLPVQKKTKTGYSTDQESLERLAGKHPIASAVLEHRKIYKLIHTYTNVLRAAVDGETGRIHALFQQTAGATGRLIVTDPDLQRTPVKTPEGRRIREAFIARAGSVIVSADWSQIELRLLAHISGDPALAEAFAQGVDVHRRTASQLFRVAEADVTGDQRRIGKTVNFATIYGQGATALGQILGVERKEAQGYIARYFEVYAGVAAWAKGVVERAHERGFVETLFGRRRNLPELSSQNPIDRQAGERIAVNTCIQGAAADLCKQAMLDIARAFAAENLGARMVLQIHDELLVETPEAEVPRVTALLREKMEHATPLSVPLVVDVGVGKSWAEAH